MSNASLPPPGSNVLCSGVAPEAGRVRREWDRMDDYDRALYLDAVETAIERGLHQRFAEFHADEVSDVQAHDTCAFFLWHRAFILAYENMLRSLRPRFACLTLPWWDVHRDYAKQEATADPCRSYATCARIVNDLGGQAATDDWAEGTFFGREGRGVLYARAPVQHLRDDDGFVGLIRYDMDFDPIPAAVAVLSAEGIATLFGKKGRFDFWETLHHGMHDAVHDTIGGFMRTTASPIDPIFMPWHSTMELLDYIWRACHGDETLDEAVDGEGPRCAYTPSAREYFPNISLATDEAWIKLGAVADVRDDALIGSYFNQDMQFADLWNVGDPHNQFSYADIPLNFVEALGNNTMLCPYGLGDSDADVSNEQRQPPEFSNEQLESTEQGWMDQAQEYYRDGGDSDTAGRNMNFLRCLLSEMDRDTLERWAIDEDTFMTQIVKNKRYNSHPLCRGHLSASFQTETDSPTSAPHSKLSGLTSMQPSVDPIVEGASANSGHVQVRGGGLEMLFLPIILYIVSHCY